MMGQMKMLRLFNRISGGGISGSQLDSYLDADTLGAFRESLSWGSTRLQVMRSPEAFSTMADSDKMMATFLMDKDLWSQALQEEISCNVLATSTFAIDKAASDSWSWNYAMTVPNYYNGIFNDPAMLSHLGVSGIANKQGLFENAMSNANSLAYLFDDVTRATEAFNSTGWYVFRNNTTGLRRFTANIPAFTGALENNPARLNQASTATKRSALTQSDAVVDTLRAHENKHEVVTYSDYQTRSELITMGSKPTYFASIAYNKELSVVGDDGSEKWTRELLESIVVEGIEDGSGCVIGYSKHYNAGANNSVIKKILFASGPEPVASVGLTININDSAHLRVSANGRYVAVKQGNYVLSADFDTGSILVDGIGGLVTHTTINDIDIDDSGTVYLGTNYGYVAAVDSSGTVLWDRAVNANGKTEAIKLWNGGLLSFHYNNDNIYLLNTTTGANIRSATIPFDARTKAGMIFPDPYGGGVYVAHSSSSGHIQYLDTNLNQVWVSTNSSVRLDAAYGGAVDPNTGKLYFYYNDKVFEVENSAGGIQEEISGGGNKMFVSPGELKPKLIRVQGVLGVATSSGITPYQLSSSTLLVGDWIPFEDHENGSDMRMHWLNDELVIHKYRFTIHYDRETGALVGGTRPPGTNNDGNDYILDMSQAEGVVFMAYSGERVYAGYNGLLFMNSDGTIRWHIDRQGADATSHPDDVYCYGNGFIYVTTGARVERYRASDGLFLDDTSIGANNCYLLYGGVYNRVIMIPGPSSGSYYVREFSGEPSGSSYHGTSSFWRPWSSYTSILSFRHTAGVTVAMYRNTNTNDRSLRVGKVPLLGDLTGPDELEFTGTWLAANTGSDIVAADHDPVSGRLVVLDGDTGDVYAISNWENGETGASATKIATGHFPVHYGYARSCILPSTGEIGRGAF